MSKLKKAQKASTPGLGRIKEAEMKQIISLKQAGGNRGSTVAQIVDVKGLGDWSAQPFMVEMGNRRQRGNWLVQDSPGQEGQSWGSSQASAFTASSSTSPQDRPQERQMTISLQEGECCSWDHWAPTSLFMMLSQGCTSVPSFVHSHVSGGKHRTES